MITLRDYQDDLIARVREAMKGHRRVLMVMATGGGKTACFSYIAGGVYQRNKRVLILAHRKELIRQIGDALHSWDVPFGLIISGSNVIPNENVVIGSVFTVVKRISKLIQPDLIICDEAHHLIAASTFGKVVNAFPEARLLGVTATPCRASGDGLSQSFDKMVIGPSVAELTEWGYLSPAEVYAPSTPDLSKVKRRMGDFAINDLANEMNKPTITGNAVQTYIRVCPNARAIAFCVSIAHAKAVAEEFRSFGITSESVDGSMADYDRDRVLNGLRDGKIKVVTSADLISEGLDIPAVECAILLRPTKSLGLYIQQTGRALRIAPDKSKTTILDHAGNSLEHGFIDEPREWTLDGGAPKKKKSAPTVRTCPSCFAAHRPAPKCPMCGYAYVPEGRENTLNYVNGELIKVVDPKTLKKVDLFGPDDNPNETRRKELKFLTQQAKARGYRNPEGWAYVVVRAREAKRRTKMLQKTAMKQAAHG